MISSTRPAHSRPARPLPSAFCLGLATALLASTLAAASAQNLDPSSPPNAALSPAPEASKKLLPEDMLQGTIQERRARRKACATQWQHLKHTQGPDGQTWRDFTFKCYAGDVPATK